MVLCHETQLEGQMGMGKGISLRQLNSHLEKAKVVVLGRRTRKKKKGFPGWLGGKGSACHCRKHGLDPWSGETPHAAGNSARVPQVLSLCSRARELQPLSPRAWVCPQQEKPLQYEACAPQLENPHPRTAAREKPTPQQRPNAAQKEIHK